MILVIPDARNVAQVRDQWENRYSGLSNAFKPVVWKGGIGGYAKIMGAIILILAFPIMTLCGIWKEIVPRNPIGIGNAAMDSVDLGSAATMSVGLSATDALKISGHLYLPDGLLMPCPGRVSDALQWETKWAAMSLAEDDLFEPVVLIADWSTIPEIDGKVRHGE